MPGLLVAIMDTPEFQRLNDIKQLGGCSHVYPSAVHTRKEHSIGTAHLAGTMVRHLRTVQRHELEIDDAESAALVAFLGTLDAGVDAKPVWLAPPQASSAEDAASAAVR